MTGTVNIFEAARHAGVSHVAYASSVAVYGPPELYPPGRWPPMRPWRRARSTAFTRLPTSRWHGSTGTTTASAAALRPYTVYGLGNDQA